MKKSSKAQDNSNLKLTVFWGDILYDTAICKPHESITIGPMPGNTFVLPLGESGNQSLQLVKVFDNETAEFQFDDDVDGHLKIGKDFLSLAAAKTSKHVTRNPRGHYVANLTKSDSADAVVGHMSFYLEWTKEVDRISRSEINTKRLLFLLALLLFVGVSMIFLPGLLPEEEPEKPPERLVTILPKAQVAKAAMGERITADGGAQAGEAGKAAMTAPAKPSAAESIRKANLGSLVSALTNMGHNSPQVNENTQDAKAPVSQVGTGGFTTQGMKSGAGGKTVGIGRTVGQGQGGFEGTGRLGLSGNSTVEGGTGHGTDGNQAGGGLDRDVIESIIKRRQDRIRLCYERQLNFYPKLSGKIAIHFVIGKTGNVVTSAISEDTMKNASVRSCILNEVKTWTFPPPQGGTLVNVDYPFVFESSAKTVN